jgi:hypothetical protein
VTCVAALLPYSLKTMKKDLLKTLAPQPAAVVEHEDTDLNDSADLSRLCGQLWCAPPTCPEMSRMAAIQRSNFHEISV